MSDKLTVRLEAVHVGDLLGTLFNEIAHLKGEIRELRHQNADLCAQRVKALGNPTNPEELDAALERTGIAHGEPLRPRLTEEQITQLLDLARAA